MPKCVMCFHVIVYVKSSCWVQGLAREVQLLILGCERILSLEYPLAQETLKMKTTLTFAFAIATLGLFTGTASAASDLHIDDLAAQLQRETAEFGDEIEHHFRSTPSYRHLANDARKMQRLARHIHTVAHHTSARRHIALDLAQLDRIYHHVEGLVDEMDDVAKYRSRHGYHGDAYTLGRAETRHLRRALRRINATLHHLQEDLQMVPTPVYYEYRPRKFRSRTIVPPRPVFNIRF